MLKKGCMKTGIKWKRWIAVSLSTLMIAGTIPVSVFGAENGSGNENLFRDIPAYISEAEAENITETVEGDLAEYEYATEEAAEAGAENAFDDGADNVVDNEEEYAAENATDGTVENVTEVATEEGIEGSLDDVAEDTSTDGTDGTEAPAENVTEDAGKDGAENSTENVTEDATEDGIEGSPDDVTEDSNANGTEAPAENVTEDAGEDGIEGSSDDVTEDAGTEGNADGTEAPAENVTEDAGEDGIEGSPDDVTEDAGTEGNANGTEAPADDVTEDAAEGRTEGTAEEAIEPGADDGIDGGAVDSAADAAEGVTEDLSSDAAADATADTAEAVDEGAALAVETVSSGTCGDTAEWTLDEMGVLKITGNGEMIDYIEVDAPWYSLKDRIQSLVIGEGISYISAHAFYNLVNLKTVELPKSLVSVGEYAFYGCSLDNVYYAGTDEDWEKVAVSESGNTALFYAYMNYLDVTTVKKITPEIELSQTSFTFNGKQQKPSVIVRDGETVIPEDSYVLTYDENTTNVGTHEVQVDLSGDYEGSNTASYTIKAKKITPVVTLSGTSFVYNGKTRKPAVTVKDGSTKLAASNFTVTYGSGLKNAGTYKVVVKMKGNYSGSKTVTFKITPKKVTPGVTLSKSSFAYNGKAQKPSVTVKDGSTKLAAANYTLTYSKGRVNVGTYKVVVRLKGNYSGSKIVTFKITPKKVTPGVTLSRTAFVYNGKAQKPSVTVKAGSKKLAAANYTLTYSKGRANVGTYKVVVRLKGNYSGSRTVSFKILPKGTSLSSVQAGSNRMQVTWKKQAVQVRGYQIQYSGRSDFSKAATVTIANTNAVSRTVGNLTKGTVYYVRVRTYKTVGGTNYYSSWSSARSVRITAGTATIFTQTPSVSIKAESDTMANTLTWKKLSGATGYEISYKKGDNGNWGVLKRVTQTKITHKVTHGVYYYYRVRAYKDKADGSRIYSSYSAEKSMMHYYTPSYRTYITDRSDADTLYFIMAIENTGSCNLRIYSRNARLIDHDYTSFNRDMYLIDNEEMLNYKTLKGISSLVIKPGEIKIVTFWVEGNNSTWVDNKSTLYYEFNYDGVDYYAYTSKYYGTSFYEDH